MKFRKVIPNLECIHLLFHCMVWWAGGSSVFWLLYEPPVFLPTVFLGFAAVCSLNLHLRSFRRWLWRWLRMDLSLFHVFPGWNFLHLLSSLTFYPVLLMPFTHAPAVLRSNCVGLVSCSSVWWARVYLPMAVMNVFLALLMWLFPICLLSSKSSLEF